VAGVLTIGLISDTHGLLRPEAVHALRGADLIFHAGDVGGAAVLNGLMQIAVTRAVYGNVDAPGPSLAAAIDCDLDGARLHVSHGHEIGRPTPDRLVARYPADIIVFGHTHRALVEQVGSTLVINPGAAGPARFNLKPSVALLTLPDREVRIVEL
jgi:putative phosphoesterase